MKTSWKGSISFGMVYFPVNVYTATTGAEEVKFHYLHRKCNTRVRYKKYCETCGVEVPQEDLVRGYEYEKDNYILITDEEYEKLPIKSKKTISILNFVDKDEVDPIYLDKAYYISPSNFSAGKAFELFRRAMQQTGKVGVAKITLSSNEYVSIIKPYEKGGLLLYLLYYANEIRNPENIAELNYQVDIHENEMKMATSLIGNMTSEFDINEYRNEYQVALKKLIQAKIEGREVITPPETQNNIIDLMEALKASVEATRSDKPKAAGAKTVRTKRTGAGEDGTVSASARRKAAGGTGASEEGPEKEEKPKTAARRKTS